jgi:hypothetical protein
MSAFTSMRDVQKLAKEIEKTLPTAGERLRMAQAGRPAASIWPDLRSIGLTRPGA